MRLVRAAIAAHVDGAGGEAGGGDRPNLVAPGIPGLRKAVDHDHQRTGALDGAIQLQLADLDGAKFGHDQRVSAPRSMESTPVRETSTNPKGRIRSVNLSTLDGAPVISKMKLSLVVSITRARKMSARRSASTRSAPTPRTLTRASSRSTPFGSRLTSWT